MPSTKSVCSERCLRAHDLRDTSKLQNSPSKALDGDEALETVVHLVHCHKRTSPQIVGAFSVLHGKRRRSRVRFDLTRQDASIMNRGVINEAETVRIR